MCSTINGKELYLPASEEASPA